MHHEVSTLSSIEISSEKREAGADETGKVMLSGPCAMVTKPKPTFNYLTRRLTIETQCKA